MKRSYVDKITLGGDAKQMAGGFPEVNFSPGVNILAGPNGSGKSTILQVIANKDWCAETGSTVSRVGNNLDWIAYDGEKQNPRFSGEHGPLQFVNRHASHGQVQRRVFQFLNERLGPGMLVMLDEPEAAMDLTGAVQLRNVIASRHDLQWIIATHHPALWTMTNARVIELHPGHVAQQMRLWKSIICR